MRVGTRATRRQWCCGFAAVEQVSISAHEGRREASHLRHATTDQHAMPRSLGPATLTPRTQTGRSDDHRPEPAGREQRAGLAEEHERARVTRTMKSDTTPDPGTRHASCPPFVLFAALTIRPCASRPIVGTDIRPAAQGPVVARSSRSSLFSVDRLPPSASPPASPRALANPLRILPSIPTLDDYQDVLRTCIRYALYSLVHHQHLCLQIFLLSIRSCSRLPRPRRPRTQGQACSCAHHAPPRAPHCARAP
jgi:hypothetical protein